MNLRLIYIYNNELKTYIYNIVLKGLIGNDINSISNELETYTVSATPRRKIFFMNIFLSR